MTSDDDKPSGVDVEEGRRLLAAMTPGTWGCYGGYGPLDDGLMRCLYVGHVSGSGIRTEPDSEDINGESGDFEGVCWLRNNAGAAFDKIDALLSEVAALREEVEKLREDAQISDEICGLIRAELEKVDGPRPAVPPMMFNDWIRDLLAPPEGEGGGR